LRKSYSCATGARNNAWADTAAQPRAATESLVTIPHSIQPFWLEFQAIVGGDVQARFYEAFHFDDNEPAPNELARLVLVGTKRATAGLAWSFEAENRPPPKPSDLSVVTNWQGEPLCVIETKAVATVSFEEVSEEFAAIEGEGDGSLRYWREVHWAYFGRVCKTHWKSAEPENANRLRAVRGHLPWSST
jgi:uncharacterized protein YhfF